MGSRERPGSEPPRRPELPAVESVHVSTPFTVGEFLNGLVTPTSYLFPARGYMLHIRRASGTEEYALVLKDKVTGRRLSQTLLDATRDQNAFGGYDVADKKDWLDLFDPSRPEYRLQRLGRHAGFTDPVLFNLVGPLITGNMSEQEKDIALLQSGMRTFYHYHLAWYNTLMADHDGDYVKPQENTNEYLVAVARWQTFPDGTRRWLVGPKYLTDPVMQELAAASTTLFPEQPEGVPVERFDAALGILAVASLQRDVIEQWPLKEGFGHGTQTSGSTQTPGLILGRRGAFFNPRIFERLEQHADNGQSMQAGQLAFAAEPTRKLPLPPELQPRPAAPQPAEDSSNWLTDFLNTFDLTETGPETTAHLKQYGLAEGEVFFVNAPVVVDTTALVKQMLNNDVVTAILTLPADQLVEELKKLNVFASVRALDVAVDLQGNVINGFVAIVIKQKTETAV